MQSSDRVLAKRYARALFQSAAEGQAPRLRKELGAALKVLRDHQAALRHPLLPAAEKARLLRGALGEQAREDTRRFLEVLIRRKRFELLPAVAAEFEQIADEAAQTARAHVRVARPLAEPERAALESRLARVLGRAVVLDVKEDPTLIGGIVVRVGDQVLDASVARQLERLKEKLLAA